MLNEAGRRRTWLQVAAKCPGLRQLKHRAGTSTAGAGAASCGGQYLRPHRTAPPAPSRASARNVGSHRHTSQSPLLFAGPPAPLSEREAEDIASSLSQADLTQKT